MKKFVITFCLLVFIIQFVQIIYFERSTFATKYDTEYWKDRYEHSQYQLPLSKRIIGDDGLYAYIGYQLVKGGNPAGENAQAPPIGKYLIGLSILIFHNPAYYALFLGIGSIVIFYFLSRFFLKDSKDAIFVATLLLLDPLYFTQAWKPWLDIAQLFFLLLNLIFLIRVEKSPLRHRIIYVVLSGFSLGCFIATKTSILLPIILSIETIYFLRKGFRREYIVFIVGIILTILFAYTRYFLLGHSLVDFLKLQKYVVSFWLQTKLDVHMNAIWQTLLFGKFPHITTGIPSIVPEWWIAWPIITILGVSSICWIFSKKESLLFKGGAVFILGSLITYTFIPSYPRYLLIVLPFLYLFSIKALDNLVSIHSKRLLYIGILLYGLLHATLFLFPRPEAMLNNFYYNFSHQYFQDIYAEDLSKNDKLLINRDKFRYIAQNALSKTTVKDIQITEKEKIINNFSDKGSVKIDIFYKTQDLGGFHEEKAIDLIREDGKWKIKWNWDMVLNEFIPSYSIDTNIILGKRGSIIDVAGNTLARDSSSYLILFNPNMMDSKKEREMLKFIQNYGYKGDVSIQNAYLENVLSGDYVPLITFQTIISDKEKNKLLSYGGIKIIEYPSRIYKGSIDFKSLQNTFYDECCTRIYSSYNYHGVKGIEKKYDSILWGYSGGNILMKDDKGSIIKVIFKKDKKDGKDVVLQQ